jgi:thioredoxin-related protein
MRLLISSLLAISASFVALHAEKAAHKPATEGAQLGQWTQDWDAAVNLAAEKNKAILVNFTGSDWCGWCKLMDKKVFAEEQWVDYAKENLLLVTIDFPRDKSIVPKKYKERNEKLKNQFGVRGFPTYILLDQDGETKVGKLGASREATPKNFIQQVEEVLRFTASGIAKFTEGMPEEKVEEYKGLLAAHKAAEKKLMDWLDTRPQRTEENTKKFHAFQEDITSAKAKIKSFQ